MRTVVRATLLSFSLLAAPISVPAATAAAPAGGRPRDRSSRRMGERMQTNEPQQLEDG